MIMSHVLIKEFTAAIENMANMAISMIHPLTTSKRKHSTFIFRYFAPITNLKRIYFVFAKIC